MVLILILLGLCYFLEKGRRRWVMKIIKMDKKIENWSSFADRSENMYKADASVSVNS